MSKNKKSSRHDYYDYEYEDDYVDSKAHKQEKRDRRNQRRMKNALKTKNIDDLMRYEEEY